MAVVIYRSTDASAPTLSGTAGSLTTVLDAVLVTGYGSQPAAGWSIAFTATNARAYQQGSGSNGYYLRVNDTAAQLGTTHEAVGTPTARESRIRGYEIMTALSDSGLNLFPTVAQQASGLFVRKSTTLDATARPWIIAADQRTLYMFVLTGDAAGTYFGWAFGEFFSLKQSTDLGRTMIIGRNTENTNSQASSTDQFDGQHVLANMSGHFTTRDSSNSPVSTFFSKFGDFGITNYAGTQIALNGAVAFTNPADAKIYASPVWIHQTSPVNNVRGRMRGFWLFGHPAAAASDGDTFTGTGDLTGKSFLIIKAGTQGGLFAIETSNTWDTN